MCRPQTLHNKSADRPIGNRWWTGGGGICSQHFISHQLPRRTSLWGGVPFTPSMQSPWEWGIGMGNIYRHAAAAHMPKQNCVSKSSFLGKNSTTHYSALLFQHLPMCKPTVKTQELIQSSCFKIITGINKSIKHMLITSQEPNGFLQKCTFLMFYTRIFPSFDSFRHFLASVASWQSPQTRVPVYK